VFRNGTCVFSTDPMEQETAISLLRKHGGVEPGMPSGDFGIARVEQPEPGYLVRYSHPSILHFEADGRLSINESEEAMLGLLLRTGRQMDAADPRVIYFWKSSDA